MNIGERQFYPQVCQDEGLRRSPWYRASSFDSIFLEA